MLKEVCVGIFGLGICSGVFAEDNLAAGAIPLTKDKVRESFHQPLRAIPVQDTELEARSPPIITEDQYRQSLMDNAKKLLKKPYRWNTSGPDYFDCSGFVHFNLKKVLGEQRFPMPYQTEGPTSVFYRNYLEQHHAELADCKEAKIGDIVFFPADRATGIAHIGLLSDPQKQLFITAQGKLWGVREDAFGSGTYWGQHSPKCYRNIWITNSQANSPVQNIDLNNIDLIKSIDPRRENH